MGKRVVKMNWSLQLFSLTKDSGFKSSHHQGHIHQKDNVIDECKINTLEHTHSRKSHSYPDSS